MVPYRAQVGTFLRPLICASRTLDFELMLMKNYRWLLAVALAVIIVLGFWIWRRGSIPQEIDLIAAFPTAEKRTSLSAVDRAFNIVSITIDGQSQRAIFMHPTSRLIWKVTVPHNGWLRTSLALRPESWKLEGDGVLFRIGVSDGRKYDELLNQHVNPHAVPEDRRWIPVTVDLSPYAGQQVDVIFNTNNSPPRTRPADQRNDWAVWGSPQIYVWR